MLKIKHLKKNEIKDYLVESLSEDRQIEIEEHLAICDKCNKLFHEKLKAQFFWNNWTARRHGEVYWRKRASKVLKDYLALAKTPDLRKRLERWINVLGGKNNGIVHIILKSSSHLKKNRKFK